MSQDPTPPIPRERLAALAAIPYGEAPSPSYVLELDCLEENARTLKNAAQRSGAKILLALKGFACHPGFPRLRPYLSGTTASGLHEALLAREYFGREIHVYAPAFKTWEITRLSRFAHTIIFNTPHQLTSNLPYFAAGYRPDIGLRVNPEHTSVQTELYDPCAPASRLGATRAALDRARDELPENSLSSIDGLHFHALCEQGADDLEATADAFEAKFGDLIPGMRWLNFGGGHHITRPGYDIDRLCRIVRRFRKKYDVEVYLEPGEAVALHTGILVATVLDCFENNGHRLALLDTSATCHMPDVLEMPYRPEILGAGAPGEHPHTFRLGGMSCLAGDVIGDYSFPHPLTVGQRLVFLDMAHYTMVKNTTFNGVPLPSICLYDRRQGLDIVRRFGYEDYRTRLGGPSSFADRPL
ncbi:MAG: carboxynorspermidine decarboxylase [Opitutales bacterium]